MLYPTDERAADQRSVDDLLPTSPDGDGLAALDADAMAEAVRNLRALIMAGERYRLTAAGSVGLGATESSAISYLAVHGIVVSPSSRATSISPAAQPPRSWTGSSGTARPSGSGTPPTDAARRSG